MTETSAPGILAVVQPTRGAGKTVLVLELAASLALSGESVLMIDLDAGGGLTRRVGAQPLSSGILDGILRGEEDPVKIGLMIRSVRPGIDLLPSVEAAMTQEFATAGRRLRQALVALGPQYGWCLIDCPPREDTRTATAIVASDRILVPINPGCGVDGVVADIEAIVPSVSERLTLVRTIWGDREGADAALATNWNVAATIIPRWEPRPDDNTDEITDIATPKRAAFVQLAKELNDV